MSDDSRFVITAKGVLTEYRGNDEILEIPQGVKAIGSNLLGYRKGEAVRTVIIPEGVTEIKPRAFSSSDIEAVSLPSTLCKIGEDAFGYCRNLKQITIPDGVTEIPNMAFWMSGLEEIHLPVNLKKIGDGAFQHCEHLKTINLPDLTTLEIGSKAFTGCKSLVDEKGFLILQNRLFTYYSEQKKELFWALAMGLCLWGALMCIWAMRKKA